MRRADRASTATGSMHPASTANSAGVRALSVASQTPAVNTHQRPVSPRNWGNHLLAPDTAIVLLDRVDQLRLGHRRPAVHIEPPRDVE